MTISDRLWKGDAASPSPPYRAAPHFAALFLLLIASSRVLYFVLGQLCFADCPMKAALIGTGIVLALAIPAHAIECQLSKGAHGYHWAWREIDGRRCWYEGEPGLAKSELHWPTSLDAVAPPLTEPSPAAQLHSPKSPDAIAPLPTEPPPPDQTTLSYWKGNGDGKLIEKGTSIHVLQTDPPSISRAITFDGTSLATNAPWPSAKTSFRTRWSAWQGNPNVMQFETYFSGQSK